MLSLVQNNEIMEEKELPEPPEEMSFEAKCEFIENVGYLIDHGMYEGPNVTLFKLYCNAVGDAKFLEQNLAEDGLICGGKPHPAYKMKNEAVTLAKNLWDAIKPKKLIVKEGDEEESWGKDKGLLA
jgi:phage terminase small subunit